MRPGTVAEAEGLASWGMLWVITGVCLRAVSIMQQEEAAIPLFPKGADPKPNSHSPLWGDIGSLNNVMMIPLPFVLMSAFFQHHCSQAETLMGSTQPHFRGPPVQQINCGSLSSFHQKCGGPLPPLDLLHFMSWVPLPGYVPSPRI